jgi:hypothetical protein
VHPCIAFPYAVLCERAAVADAELYRHHVGQRIRDGLRRQSADDANEGARLSALANGGNDAGVKIHPTWICPIPGRLNEMLTAAMREPVSLRKTRHQFRAWRFVLVPGVENNLMAKVHHHNRKLADFLGKGASRKVGCDLRVWQADKVEAH